MSETDALVLVVDDNEMNRDMLSRRLKRMNYQVIVAEDGEQALQLIKVHPFNLILLDIMMPNISGYDVLARIKQDDATKHLPVIMISAVDDLDSVVRCIELGAEDYLFKPFNPVLLKARISASLQKNRLAAGNLIPIVQSIQAALVKLHASGLSDTQQTQVDTIQQQLDVINDTLNI
ncbi:MAG: response regulator [Anaerolineae bacterium]